MPTMKLSIVLCLCLVLAAACGTPTPVVVVPTLASLPTETETDVPTQTPFPTETGTLPPTGALPPTATFSLTPSETFTPSPVPTDTATHTPTHTFTPSLTITDTITPTLTLTPTPTRELPVLGGLAAMAANVTVLPPEIRYGTATLTAMALMRPTVTSGVINGATPTAVIPGTYTLATLPPPPTSCQYPPPGNLNSYVVADPSLQVQLGCPVGAPPVSTLQSAAWQSYERGTMLYLQETPPSIYALSSDGRFRRFDDTFVSGVDPENGGETPPPGLFEPIRGFGKVWRANLDIRALLGWARDGEHGENASVQAFERGRAVYLAGLGQTFFLIYDAGSISSGTWRVVNGGF